MTALNTRATVMAIKEETTSGTLIVPAAAGDFIPLRSGFSFSPGFEELTNDELLNNLGASKSQTGKESITGSHPIYLKNSGTSGTAPETSLLFESALGTTATAAAEYNTVAGSTTSVVNVDAGEGATFQTGEALLVQDTAAGRNYSIRNVQSIATDAITLNFALPNAPGAGINLGKAHLIHHNITGPSYSVWQYIANGGAIQAAAGCRTSSITMNFPAGQTATADISYEGTNAYWNPIYITASNKFLDITDDGGTILVTLTEGFYSPQELAAHIAAAATTASLASGSDTIGCTYSNTTGKFTITSTGTPFSILWKTGTKGSDNTDTHVGTTIGFSDAADDTGATSYTSDSAIDYSAGGPGVGALTPSYDGQNNLVVRNCELLIGDDNTYSTCRKAGNVTITINSSVVDADSICASTGVSEKVRSARTVEISADLILDQYESDYFDWLTNNTGVRVALNVGSKTNGNWDLGKCLNIYCPNCSITGHTVSGEDYSILNLTAKAYVTSTHDDIYINFV